MQSDTARQTHFMDRFIPREILERDADTIRRARTAVLFAGMTVVNNVLLSVLYGASGMAHLALPLAGMSIPFLFIPLVMRMTRSLFVSQLYAQFFVLTMLALIMYYNGGFYSATTMWLAAMPICALLSEGPRSAKIVFVAVTLCLIFACYLAMTNYPWPAYNEQMRAFSTLFNALSFTAFIHYVGQLYEHATTRMRRELESEKAGLQLVLDSVGQGFLTVNASGGLLGKHSAIVKRWFGESAEGDCVWSYLGKDQPAFAQLLELHWSMIVDDLMPLELVVEQLPRELVSAGRHLRIEYRPLVKDDKLSAMVLVISDVTDLLQAEQAEAQQREFAAVLDTALRDRLGFGQFIEEANQILEQLESGCDDALRLIHTLKGNCGMVGVRSVAAHCHDLESRLSEAGRLPNADEIAALRAIWKRFADRMQGVLDVQGRTLEVSEQDVQALRNAVAKRLPYATLDRMLKELEYEPALGILQRLAGKARGLGKRLGKGDVDVQVHSDPVRLNPKHWRAFWASFIHAVRNAIDHGLETPLEREASGKASSGQLRLALHARADSTVIELHDDGRGIDWDRVRERATERGLPATCNQDLVQALFADGLSTRTEVTEVSGRGVGLGALADATRALGGHVDVESFVGRGTLLRVVVPAIVKDSMLPPAA